MVPPGGEETCFRCPAHAKSRPSRSAVVAKHPSEIHIVVNLRGQILNRCIRKIFPAREHAAKKNRSIDRRHFGVERARTGGHVHEVIEETVHPHGLHGVEEKAQSSLHATDDSGVRLVAALIANALRRKPVPGGGDAGNGARVVARGHRAIFHLAGFRIGLLPEKKKSGFFDFFQELRVASAAAALHGKCQATKQRASSCVRKGGEKFSARTLLLCPLFFLLVMEAHFQLQLKRTLHYR